LIGFAARAYWDRVYGAKGAECGVKGRRSFHSDYVLLRISHRLWLESCATKSIPTSMASREGRKKESTIE